MPALFEPFTLGSLTVKNRVVMSPMCQYSVWDEDGAPGDWHYTHYLSRAIGGAGLILMEMTDVVPDGRITVRDLGFWSDAQIPAYRRITDAVHETGAKIGIQLAHAGRKTESPGLTPEAPSAIRFSERYRVPRELTEDEVRRLVDAFGAAARRAVAAGVDTLELHGAHGYLIHQFLSPASNHRRDRYQDPVRFAVEVIRATKAEMPSGMPLWMRISATEYLPPGEGYQFEDLLGMIPAFIEAGVDGFDVSSGGNAPVTPPRVFAGYQVPYAAAVKERFGVPVIAVGMLEDFDLAEATVSWGRADLIAVARGLLRQPYWANEAARHLGGRVQVPRQYYRAQPAWFLEQE